MTRSAQQVLEELDRKKWTLDRRRPLPPATLESLRAWLRVETTYTSNAIEGNRLDRAETTVVLEGLTVGGKRLRDHLEAIDHADAFDFMITLADRDEPFTEADVRAIHHLVLGRSNAEAAGRYREVQVYITGSLHVPPPPSMVPALVGDLFAALREHRLASHPVAEAAIFHARFEDIHPFVDGNGRTGRLAANLLLMRAGYPPAIIYPEQRADYFGALAACAAGDSDVLVRLFAEAAERTANFILSAYDRSPRETRSVASTSGKARRGSEAKPDR